VQERSSAAPALAAALACLVGLTACDTLLSTDQDAPGSARVVIEGTAEAPLRLVTSADFDRVFTGEGAFPVLITSDTVLVTPPFDQRYDITEHLRFFAQLTNPDEAEANVTMRVFFDDEEFFDESSALAEGTKLEFSFLFQR